MELKILSDDPVNVRNRELYDWHKSHGICVNCCCNEAYNGGVYCLVCRMDKNGRRQGDRKMTTEQRQRKNEHNRRRKDLYFAFGRCSNCGKRDTVPGKSLCSVCLAKARAHEESKRRENGIIPRSNDYSGMCYLCKKLPPVEGKKLCESCYSKSVQSIAYARTFINTKEHIWQNYETYRLMTIRANKEEPKA